MVQPAGVRAVVMVSIMPAQGRLHRQLARTSLRVAMVQVQVQPARQSVQRISGLMQARHHAHPVIATMQTVVIQQHHMQV